MNSANVEASGTCGRGVDPVRAHQYTIAVRVVVSGVLLDSVVVIHALGARLPGNMIGAEVFAWGIPVCEYGWSHWGNVMRIEADGRLHPNTELVESVQAWQARSNRPFTMEVVEAELRSRARSNPIEPYLQTSGLYSVLVTKSDYGKSKGYPLFDVRVLSQPLGEKRSGPNRLSFSPPLNEVCDRINVGDTLLVPRTADLSRRAFHFECCPDAFKVRDGIVSGLRLPMDRVSSAFVQQDSTYLLPARRRGTGTQE